jgi:hypothetical protein
MRAFLDVDPTSGISSGIRNGWVQEVPVSDLAFQLVNPL